MHARLKYFSLLVDAINCFSDRGSSTEIKVKHILAIEETLDLGFELGIESVQVLFPRSPRVAFASNWQGPFEAGKGEKNLIKLNREAITLFVKWFIADLRKNVDRNQWWE